MPKVNDTYRISTSAISSAVAGRSKRNALVACAVATSVFASPAYAQEQEAASLTFNSALDQLVDDGKILFNGRLRYSFADFGSLEENANGVTYRIRAGFETGALFDTKILVDFDHVRSPLDDFNSTINGNTQFPVVADPDVTELNRFHLTNTSIDDTTVTLGRQRIIHDDARFIGNVGWRQNEQTYDALRIVNKSVSGLTVDVAYVDQVNRIFGDDSPQGRFESDSFFVNLKYKVPSNVVKATVTGFAYMLDFENPNIPIPAARLSTQTYGGNIALSYDRFKLRGTYANQAPYGSNPVDFDVNYYTVEGAASQGPFSLTVGYEVLGGNGEIGFSTPLSTAHKFNGFADLFLATPADGLSDVYVKAGYAQKDIGPFLSLKGVVAYHTFSAEETDQDYGDEVDLLFVGKLKATKRLTYLIKYANFQAATGFAQDVTRLTAEVNVAF